MTTPTPIHQHPFDVEVRPMSRLLRSETEILARRVQETEVFKRLTVECTEREKADWVIGAESFALLVLTIVAVKPLVENKFVAELAAFFETTKRSDYKTDPDTLGHHFAIWNTMPDKLQVLLNNIWTRKQDSWSDWMTLPGDKLPEHIAREVAKGKDNPFSYSG